MGTDQVHGDAHSDAQDPVLNQPRLGRPSYRADGRKIQSGDNRPNRESSNGRCTSPRVRVFQSCCAVDFPAGRPPLRKVEPSATGKNDHVRQNRHPGTGDSGRLDVVIRLFEGY
jgi:hypothetical protein